MLKIPKDYIGNTRFSNFSRTLGSVWFKN